MTATAVIEIVAWGTKALAVIIEAINAAVQSAAPPSLEELRKKVQAAIDAHHAEWLKDARAEADRVLAEAAATEFDEEIGKEMGKP